MRRNALAEEVVASLAAMSPAARAEAVASLLSVIDAQLMEGAARDVASCPHCNGTAVRKNGHDRAGSQRYHCKGCGKMFSAKSMSVLAYSKLPAGVWKRYVDCFVDALPLRECAKRCGVSLKTAFFMRHRIIECIFPLLPSFQVEVGVSAELDETFSRESFKGNHDRGSFDLSRPARRRGGSLRKRGVSSEQICVMTGINDYGDMFYEVAKRGPLTEGAAREVLSDKIAAGAVISTDQARGCAKLLLALGVATHNACSSKDRSEGTINHVNALHSSIDHFMRPFRGVSTRRLAAYMAWYKWARSFGGDGRLSEVAVRQVMNGTYSTRWREYKDAPFLLMDYWKGKAA